MQLAILTSGSHYRALDQGDGSYEVSIQPEATQDYLDYLAEHPSAHPILATPIEGFPNVTPVKPSGQDRTIYINFTSDSLDKIPSTLAIGLRDSLNASFWSSFSIIIDKPVAIVPVSGPGPQPGPAPVQPVWVKASAEELADKDQSLVVGVGGSAFIDASGFLHQPDGSVWKRVV